MPNCNLSDAGDTSLTISLYHFVHMLKTSPNTCGKLYLLNQYVPTPSPVITQYILGHLNKDCRPCTSDPRFTYDLVDNKWEWF